MNWIAIAVGALIGGGLRYVFEVTIPTPASLPLGTLMVNLIGAFLLGFIYYAAEQKDWPAWMRLGLGTGMIGAFTTFSTFCLELVELSHKNLMACFGYGIGSLLGGVLFVMIGEWIAGTLLDHKAIRAEELYS